MRLRLILPRLAVACAALGSAACSDEAAVNALQVQMTAKADRADTQAALDRAQKAAQDAREETRKLQDHVTSLELRIAELEARPAAAATTASAPGDAAHAADAAKPKADRQAQLDELKKLQQKVFSGDATDEEEQRFWELARTTGAVDDLMKSLEAKVAEHPEDNDARMQLASSYIAKLLSIPQGPAQASWSMKAEAQWKKVLEKDPDHWDARYSIAFNWSMWPDFLNKTPDAVKEFEKLREVQERQPVQAKQAQTYLQLSRLYGKQGKSDKAKEILRSGLARHPDDAELKKALASLED